MSLAVATIVRFERRVVWRRRLLSLLDGLVPALAIGAFVAAGLVVLIRIRPVDAPVGAVIIAALFLSSAAALARWFFTRPRTRDAAFLIDASLGLDDRVATSHSIIERGGPNSVLEEALIEDTAERTSGHKASSVVRFRLRKRHSLPLVSLIALAGGLMISPRPLPATEAPERAEIDSAAEHLERTAVEVEQVVPPETETARLASEQAELGRGFQKAATTRAEALRRLSGLEERIRRRHDELASTRADEIVSLADRRLGGALSTLPEARHKSFETEKSQLAVAADATPDNPKTQTRSTKGADQTPESSSERAADSHSTATKARATSASEQSPAKNTTKPGSVEAQNKPREPGSGTDSKTDPGKTAPEGADQTAASKDKLQGDQKPGEQKQNLDKRDAQKRVEGQKSDQQATDKSGIGPDALKAVPSSLINQAAKAIPKLSEDLLKKAAQLRANELSRAEVEKLRQAAETLSRELSRIAQSEDLQRALEEMARQVRPEQIEQVARELGKSEQLKQELESAARLLAANRQAKEMVAGLAGEFARVRDEIKQQQGIQNTERQDGEKSGSRSGQTGGHDQASRSGGGSEPGPPASGADRKLEGRGREASLQGKLRQSSRGEYLFLQSKAGAGAARAPYSSAYPQYRREAERSVQRTEIPANLRTVVRRYFDAINPDAKK